MSSSVLRRTNFFSSVMRNSVYRSPAAIASNNDETPSSSSLLPSPLLPSPTPTNYVPVASRYITSKRMWKFVPKLIGEDHVDPDLTVRHSFEQRMRAIKEAENDPSIHSVHDIGFPRPDTRARRQERAKELREARKRMKSDEALERASRLHQLEVDPIECELEEAVVGGGEGEDVDVARNCAQHYGVFNDLYGRHAVFANVVDTRVEFVTAEKDEDGESLVAPVYYGNFIDAVNCAKEPIVEIEGVGEDSLWTLLLTSPDQNFVQGNSEVLHWMVGNIRGSSVSSGTPIVPYLPPFPMRGFGPLRYVFVLYNQNSLIDFSALTEFSFNDPTTALATRSFSSYQFLKQHQDVLTPASQRFFQSTYDDSVNSVFYDQLDMKEPSYAYDWPEPEREPQYKFLEKTSFNEYLDLYRDRKEINEQVLKERLSTMISPFEGYPARDPWPNAVPVDNRDIPTWLQDENTEKRLRRGKWRDLDIRD